MAFDITDLPIGAVQRTAINSRFSKVKAFLLSIQGTNLKAGTVPNSALDHGRATFCMECHYTGDLPTLGSATLDGFALPNLDGAAYSAWKVRSLSAFVRVRTTPSTDTVTVTKNGSTIATLAFTSLTAATPYQASFTEDTGVTTDVYKFVYTKVGGVGLTDFSMRLFFSAAHVANS